MATGSGTGTPASAAGTTLSSLRTRVLTQVTAASSGIEPEVVTASSLTLTTMRERVETVLKSGESEMVEREPVSASAETLTTLRDRVETALQDSTNAIWATGDIDEAIEMVLDAYSRASPDRAVGTITLAAAGREVSLSTLTDLINVERVWCPYDSTTPGYPPNWVDFRVWAGSLLYVDSSDEPANTEKVRVYYTKRHTLNGLDGATATTIPIDDMTFIIEGAAAYCARFRAIEIAELANVDDRVFDRLGDWAKEAMKRFEAGLARRTAMRRHYDQDMLDEGIRQALGQYSRRRPARAISTITLSADGREIDIASVTGAVRIEWVWWDYDSSAPGHPPAHRNFRVMPGKLLYINDQDAPSSGDKVRVQYTKNQTLNLLDSATATTFASDDEAFIVAGAAAFAARFRAASSGGGSALMAWADKMMAEFNEGLRMRDWRRYTFQFDQDDVDEAIRWALGRYSEANPEVVITSVTLSAAGREVDISGITDYEQITRVWWDYDSADPVYPPEWRDFELWAGDILFLKESGEPQSGDVVRVWYKRARAINGLDSASATTLPGLDENLIVVGASGFVAQERVQDEARRYVPRKLREWADARLREFERGLKALGRRQAARHSGIAAGPPLDRWDGEWG